MLSSVLLFILTNQNEPIAQSEPRHVPQRTFQVKDLQTAKISFKNKHELTVWVMDTNAKRSEGMMFLKDSDFTEKQGMIFVFRYAQPLGFWMRNTLVDLDIAYVDQAGRIVSIYTMKSLDETTDYGSRSNAMFAIETKAGLLKKLDIKPGDTVQIPSTIKAKE